MIWQLSTPGRLRTPFSMVWAQEAQSIPETFSDSELGFEFVSMGIRINSPAGQQIFAGSPEDQEPRPGLALLALW